MTTIATGFFGKIPTRGDFVRHGLPGDFVRALDRWWQTVIPDSREILGDAWAEAWTQAPAWRFALAAGSCGAGAAIGLWLPSADSVGRRFPLTIARIGQDWSDLSGADAFLDAAEAVGRAAVAGDVGPEALATMIAGLPPPDGEALPAQAPDTSRWWTDGGPEVAASLRYATALPDGRAFASMLRDESQIG